MPSPNPTVRRQHSGNAVPTTLAAPIVNGTDASFTITSSTGWPDGSVGNFIVTINAGQSDVEKILCSTRSGTTVNVVTRGFDSTTAAGHAPGATAVHSISAVEVDEMNQHTNATSGVHGVTGAVVGTTDSQTLTGKTVNLASNTVSGTTAQFNAALSDNDFATLAGAESLSSKTLDAASTIGGVSGTTLAADRTAWTTYTPTFVNMTTPTGTFAYKLIGKTLHIRGDFTGGTVTATAATSVSFPGGVTAVASRQRVAGVIANSTSLFVASGGTVIDAGTCTAGTVLSTGSFFNAVIEVA